MTEVYAHVSNKILAEVMGRRDVPGIVFVQVSKVGEHYCLVQVEDDGAPESWVGRLVEYVFGVDTTQGGAVRVVSRTLTMGDTVGSSDPW